MMKNTATQSETVQSAVFQTPWGPGEARFAEGQLVEVTLPRTRTGAAAASDSRPHLAPAGPAAGEGGASGLTPTVAASIEALEAAARGEAPQWPDGFRPELLVEPGFRREVYQALLTVPRGDTITYGMLAREAGYPGAARAVGTAMAANPLPLVIPCHRVVRSDGSPGRYGPDDSYKVDLLRAEGAL